MDFGGPIQFLNKENAVKALAAVTSYHPQKSTIPPQKSAAMMM